MSKQTKQPPAAETAPAKKSRSVMEVVGDIFNGAITGPFTSGGQVRPFGFIEDELRGDSPTQFDSPDYPKKYGFIFSAKKEDEDTLPAPGASPNAPRKNNSLG